MTLVQAGLSACYCFDGGHLSLSLSLFQKTSMGLRGSIDLSNRLVSSLAHRYTEGTLATACAGYRVTSSRSRKIDLSNRFVSSLSHRYTGGTLATACSSRQSAFKQRDCRTESERFAMQSATEYRVRVGFALRVNNCRASQSVVMLLDGQSCRMSGCGKTAEQSRYV